LQRGREKNAKGGGSVVQKCLRLGRVEFPRDKKTEMEQAAAETDPGKATGGKDAKARERLDEK